MSYDAKGGHGYGNQKRSVRSVQASRSKRSQDMDVRLKAPIAKSDEQWLRDPPHYDLPDVDELKSPQTINTPSNQVVNGEKNMNMQHMPSDLVSETDDETSYIQEQEGYAAKYSVERNVYSRHSSQAYKVNKHTQRIKNGKLDPDGKEPLRHVSYFATREEAAAAANKYFLEPIAQPLTVSKSVVNEWGGFSNKEVPVERQIFRKPSPKGFFSSRRY